MMNKKMRKTCGYSGLTYVVTDFSCYFIGAATIIPHLYLELFPQFI